MTDLNTAHKRNSLQIYLYDFAITFTTNGKRANVQESAFIVIKRILSVLPVTVLPAESDIHVAT